MDGGELRNSPSQQRNASENRNMPIWSMLQNNGPGSITSQGIGMSMGSYRGGGLSTSMGMGSMMSSSPGMSMFMGGQSIGGGMSVGNTSGFAYGPMGSLNMNNGMNMMGQSFEERPAMEAQFFQHFTCCGMDLKDFHGLLDHFEDTHVLPDGTPDDTMRNSLAMDSGVGSGKDASSLLKMSFSPMARSYRSMVNVGMGQSQQKGHGILSPESLNEGGMVSSQVIGSPDHISSNNNQMLSPESYMGQREHQHQEMAGPSQLQSGLMAQALDNVKSKSVTNAGMDSDYGMEMEMEMDDVPNDSSAGFTPFGSRAMVGMSGNAGPTSKTTVAGISQPANTQGGHANGESSSQLPNTYAAIFPLSSGAGATTATVKAELPTNQFNSIFNSYLKKDNDNASGMVPQEQNSLPREQSQHQGSDATNNSGPPSVSLFDINTTGLLAQYGTQVQNPSPSAMSNSSGSQGFNGLTDGRYLDDGSGNNDDKPFKCLVRGCDKAYKQQNGLKYHRLHGHCGSDAENEDKPYICTMANCGKRYKNMNGLRYHYQHSGQHGAIGLQMLAQSTHPGPISPGQRKESDSPTLTSPVPDGSVSTVTSGISTPVMTGFNTPTIGNWMTNNSAAGATDTNSMTSSPGEFYTGMTNTPVLKRGNIVQDSLTTINGASPIRNKTTNESPSPSTQQINSSTSNTAATNQHGTVPSQLPTLDLASLGITDLSQLSNDALRQQTQSMLNESSFSSLLSGLANDTTLKQSMTNSDNTNSVQETNSIPVGASFPMEF